MTGFGPFLDVALNPSGLIATRLDGSTLLTDGAPLTISGNQLPVAFHAAASQVAELLARHQPLATVLVGVARGPDYRIECLANPVVTSEHPDASGRRYPGLRLGDGPRTTATDVASLVVDLAARGFETVASKDCGGYVCNSTYYSALESAPHAVFLHIPPATTEAAVAHGEALVRALLILLTGQHRPHSPGNPLA